MKVERYKLQFRRGNAHTVQRSVSIRTILQYFWVVYVRFETKEYPIRFCRKDGNDSFIDIVAVFNRDTRILGAFSSSIFTHGTRATSVTCPPLLIVPSSIQVGLNEDRVLGPLPKQPHTISEGKRY